MRVGDSRTAAMVVFTLLLAGCAGDSPRIDRLSSGVSMQMSLAAEPRPSIAPGVADAVRAVRTGCAGKHRLKSSGYRACVKRGLADRSVKLRQSADAWAARFARTHQLCYNRADFSIFRCREI